MSEENNQVKKLYRSRVERFVGGVCGGLGEYFNTDANIFRILFVIFTFLGGIGLILYIASLIIVPENPSQSSEGKKSEKDMTMFWALLFIIAGLSLLAKEFGIFNYLHFWHISWSSVWAILLIAIGILLIISVNRKKKSETGEDVLDIANFNKITRSKTNRMIAGVCSGIAAYFNIDPAIVRILWVLASLASIGLGVIVYIILIFVFPEESPEKELE